MAKLIKKSYNYWIDKEIEYLKNNYSILTVKDLQRNLNRTEISIRKKVRELKLSKYHHWTEEEIEYLKNNWTNGDTGILKLNLKNHSWNTIKNKAAFFDLKRKVGLPMDQDFFKTWTSKMAYIFGFWVADGNMGKNSNTITFTSKDYDLLAMIKSILKSEHNITSINNSFQLVICNKIFYNDLEKLGGIPAKSLIIQFPEIPDKYLSHFIRGEFDGDGSFYINRSKYLSSSFVGNIDFLSTLKDKIKENINIDSTDFRIANKNGSKRIYHLKYFNKKAIALGDYIYQDSENLRLERKFKIYKQMRNEYLKKFKLKIKGKMR